MSSVYLAQLYPFSYANLTLLETFTRCLADILTVFVKGWFLDYFVEIFPDPIKLSTL